jgi:hypothetical protein
MYDILLLLHSYFRWIVLVLALLAVARFVGGWLGNRPFTSGDDGARKFYTIALDVQFLIGLILVFISPIVAMLFDNFSGGMKVRELRFFGVEHVIAMLVAIVLAHIGAGKSKKAATDRAKFKTGAIFFSLSLVAILLGIPWFRPLFRAMSGE